MSETLDYIKTFASMPFALRRFLDHRLTVEEARQQIRARMEQRANLFLNLIEHSIYKHPRSPYLPLLKMAGCEFGDLQARVKQKGVEGTLQELRAQGVYVTFEEFKGRKPIIRNGQTIPVRVQDFDNPSMRHDITLQTGGSSGAAMNVGVDLDNIAARAEHELICRAAFDLVDTPAIRWNSLLPAGTLRNILHGVRSGHVPRRWFSPNGLRDSKYWMRYALATYYILFWLRVYGVPVPLPEYVRVEHANLVARAVAENLRAYGKCLINTSVSRALRVCLAAQAEGIDLRGATFACSSEAATVAKVAGIRQTGARFISHYGMVETSRIGVSCPNELDSISIHFFQDAFALFTHPFTVDAFDVTVPAFNLTTLLPSAPKLMLNVQMDDYGLIETKHCGCELEALGYTTHLREIRSYSKLTGEGVTLIGTEIIKILEETLPARFGGSPLDYQLLEEEDAQGFTRVYLVISPRVHIENEAQVIPVLLNALGESSPMADAARTVWQNTQALQIRRREPVLTARGKFMPVQTLRYRDGKTVEGDSGK